ncbi:dienelactone hydrolase family protein [Tumebacillus flagellatus]|uniref:Carboxymethylenebutenolidase n=1 Tax=Tumebacillus flagellatus TaxID=1157490 RepID=A0A074LS04_9BACL|nr:dienelactone hydrolase family protein [Tumebacillus flagellatus]KEO82593.1 carboxymethylenebutenolidase [Tumebacillus flagellatus]
MTLHTEWLQVEQGGQQISLYTARLENAKTPLPVVVVIQEIWGTDEHIRHVARRFAEAGYLAVAPDLYAEGGKRKPGLEENRIEAAKKFLDSLPHGAWFDEEQRAAELAKLPEPTRTEVSETMMALFGGMAANGPVFLSILQGTVDFLKTYEHSFGQKVGSVGFCMGGMLSAALANQTDLGGAIVFYGRLNPENTANVSCPVLGFFGENDPNINAMIPDYAKAMQEAGKEFEYQIYPGASHAFFNDTRVSYNVDAARDALAQSLEFFRTVLVQA